MLFCFFKLFPIGCMGLNQTSICAMALLANTIDLDRHLFPNKVSASAEDTQLAYSANNYKSVAGKKKD